VCPDDDKFISRCRNGSKQARKNAIIYYEREAMLAQARAAAETARRAGEMPTPLLTPDRDLRVASELALEAAKALLGDSFFEEADDRAEECELYSGKNEILDCRFEAGAVPLNGRVKIMLQDGSYYEGGYSNHRRHGQGTCYYSNGEMFEG